jgi:DNA-binding NarL/FixJ family response regulator
VTTHTLTERDRTILRLIAEGKRLREIAPLLGISYSGAEKAASRAMHRVPGARSSQHAAVIAEERGWLTAQHEEHA